LRRAKTCIICGKDGEFVSYDRWLQMGRVPVRSDLPGAEFGEGYTLSWYECRRCSDIWQVCVIPERTPLHFKLFERESAVAQMHACGVKDGNLGRYSVHDQSLLPMGFDQRVVVFSEVALPRIAIYFRWWPESGQVLTPDAVFQCKFDLAMSAEGRRQAPEVTFTPEQLRTLRLVNESNTPGTMGDAVITAYSIVECQHCHKPLPIKSFSTLTLRACEKGD